MLDTHDIAAITGERPPQAGRRHDNLLKLPPRCYTRDLLTGTVVRIDRGEGWHVHHALEGDPTPEQLNAMLEPEPSRAQIKAMEVGALFGWDNPAADPDHPINAVSYDPSCGLPDPHGRAAVPRP